MGRSLRKVHSATMPPVLLRFKYRQPFEATPWDYIGHEATKNEKGKVGMGWRVEGVPDVTFLFYFPTLLKTESYLYGKMANSLL